MRGMGARVVRGQGNVKGTSSCSERPGAGIFRGSGIDRRQVETSTRLILGSSLMPSTTSLPSGENDILKKNQGEPGRFG